MSLIGGSLNDVFIKFAHIEFPLFKVSSLSTLYITAPRYLFFLSLLGLPIVQSFAGGGA